MKTLSLSLLLLAAPALAAEFGADTSELAASAAKARRLEQVRAIVLRHFAAEDTDDFAEIRATFDPENAAFEDVPRGEVFQGIETILKAYEVKDRTFPPIKRRITRMIVDEKGASVEFDRCDRNTGEVYMRAAARFDVSEKGLITREVAYYDLAKVLWLLAKHPTWLKRYLLH